MNAKTALRMALTSGLIVAAAGIPAAMAGTVSNHSGTICKNYNRGDVDYIDYLSSGTRSYLAGSTSLICPLVRRTTNTNGTYAYVDVYHNTTASTTCTLYSYTQSGGLLGSTSLSWTGTGFHEFPLYLGAGKSTIWSDYAVICSIPGSYNGKIMGIDLSEL